jgi:hypothetical protein
MAAKIVLTSALIVALWQSPTANIAVDGHCVALYDTTKATEWRTDEEACAVRLSPASTFKIPHALIALETRAIKEDTIEKWDGQRFSRQRAWEKNHDLQSAISNSVVWLFQRTARPHWCRTDEGLVAAIRLRQYRYVRRPGDVLAQRDAPNLSQRATRVSQAVFCRRSTRDF